MIICNFTRSEADYLETVCNFTDDELDLFELRLRDISLEACAERMHRSIDAIKALSRKVNAKIEREL